VELVVSAHLVVVLLAHVFPALYEVPAVAVPLVVM
jgi:hypothetical protein